MTLLQIQYFCALARILHYTRTAESLHISQPGLSYAIRELEEELGVDLFEKKSRQVKLTIYGQQFLPYAEQALSLLDRGKNILEQMAGKSEQVVRLGYFQSISASLIPTIVGQFYKDDANKNIHFNFIEEGTGDIYEQIRNGGLDLAMGVTLGPEIDYAMIMHQPLYLAVPQGHHLCGQESVTFEDFAHEPMIMLDKSSNLRSLVDAMYRKHNIIPNIVFEVHECNAALQYVGLKMGVAVLALVPAMNMVNAEVLPISDDGQEFIRNVYLMWSKERPLTPASQKIRDFILNRFAI